MERARLLRSIRIWLAVVIIGLFLSGVTAFPLQTELALTVRIATHIHLAKHAPALNTWFFRVYTALADTNTRYPFLAYGTDWLAFAHLVIAAAFIGPYLDPVRNKWFITWGFIACGGVPCSPSSPAPSAASPPTGGSSTPASASSAASACSSSAARSSNSSISRHLNKSGCPTSRF